MVDGYKIRREEKIRTEYQQGNERQLEPLKGIYFDGRKDQTNARECRGKMYQKTLE